MRRTLIVIVLVLMVVGGLYLRPREVPEVELHTVQRGAVADTVANTRTGTIKACRRSRLSLPIGGQVVQLSARVGDQVKAGQVLLELWNEDRKAELTRSEAALATAKLNAGRECQLAEHDRRDAQRIASMYKRQLVSEEASDAAESRMLNSRARCAAARSEIKVTAAAREVNRALLDKTQLRAPFDGVVAEVNGEVGEYVTPSPPGVATPPAVDLIAAQCLYVEAPVDEVDASDLRMDLPARVTLDAFPGRAFAGRVTRIAPYVKDRESQARTVDVDVHLEELPADVHLLVGYSADIELILAERGAVVRVPTEMLIEGNAVLRYDAATGRLLRQRVETGLGNWSFTEITAGLAAGDRIAAALGETGVADGAQVRPAAERP